MRAARVACDWVRLGFCLAALSHMARPLGGLRFCGGSSCGPFLLEPHLNRPPPRRPLTTANRRCAGIRRPLHFHFGSVPLSEVGRLYAAGRRLCCSFYFLSVTLAAPGGDPRRCASGAGGATRGRWSAGQPVGPAYTLGVWSTWGRAGSDATLSAAAEGCRPRFSDSHLLVGTRRHFRARICPYYQVPLPAGPVNCAGSQAAGEGLARGHT